ncbi:MAG: type II secretion system GspH family protein [Puniceicoccales bacterium]|nr:type II secretion system GspH family protein [Puniceicoccales bacterium]
MGKNKRQPGFTVIEILFVLTLMVAFTACFVIRPFRTKDDVISRTKIVLSEAVFLARLHSMDPGASVELSLRNGKLEVTKKVTQNYWKKKYSKELDSRISSCELVNFPIRCKSSIIPPPSSPRRSFEAGTTPLNPVVFEEKFFLPFQLKFSLDGRTCCIAVDTHAQIQVYR